ncbi:MAG: hypothetical protein ACLR23_24840 [Clostridia bacterium]
MYFYGGGAPWILFLDACDGVSVYPIQEGDVGRKPHITKSTHGYSPYKPDYTTLFAMRGGGIAKGEVLSSMKLVDEAPTIGTAVWRDVAGSGWTREN